MEKLYTLKVTLCNDENILFRNLTAEQIEQARGKIWVSGLRRKTNLKTWELLSPFIIKSAYEIEQDAFIPE